jgi:hypothetical protein
MNQWGVSVELLELNVKVIYKKMIEPGNGMEE